MAKILILAPSGFGKSTSIGGSTELGIKGLNPLETFIISATSKPLPFRNSNSIYKICNMLLPPTKENGNRIVSNKGDVVAKAITYVSENRPDIKHLIIDDSNYIMQDYYMANAMKKGYDVFKQIGEFMDKIFTAMENANNVNIIMMAHHEEFKDSSNDTISYRYKTTGKMTQDYITPEGKFDIVFYGKQTYNNQTKTVTKEFVTNFDGQYPSKSAPGMFPDLYIPNDLGMVVEKVEEYYK